jgi:hypothetical protein
MKGASTMSTDQKPPRGRPRPAENIARDDMIYKMLNRSGPKTRNDLAEELGLSVSLTYLALSRLRGQGRVKRCLQDDGSSVWSTETERPCP